MFEQNSYFFFTTNEYVCYQSRNLRKEIIMKDQNYSSYAFTVNLVEFNTFGEVKNYKIYLSFSEIGLNPEDMKNIYIKIGDYVRENFIKNDESKVFLGCARDDNNTHNLLTFENLGFNNRTDPIHDIFNILKNIYVDGNRFFRNEDPYAARKENLAINLRDLNDCLLELKKRNQNVANLEFVKPYIFPDKEDQARNIWIPDKNFNLVKSMNNFRYLFSINYYEKLADEIGENQDFFRAKYLVDFIILLKNLLEFQNELVCAANIEKYEDYYSELSKFDFDNRKVEEKYRIRCLDSLKSTIKQNIEFFNEHQIPFKPIWFSTQMIEAEKGYLRYKSYNGLPTSDQCIEWYNKAVKGEIDEYCYSEFGGCHIKFESLPILTQVEPMNIG